MAYITKEELINDKRFYIDERNIERLMHRPILRYEVKRKKIGTLLRTRANTNKIVTLYQTRVYAYLKGTPKGVKEYDEYIDICNVSFRNRAAYDSLIVDMEKTPYDITKGAIVINQDDLIYDGQHRSCYLLHKFGPNYNVDVLQLFYESDKGMGHIILKYKIIVAKFKAVLNCLFKRFF